MNMVLTLDWHIGSVRILNVKVSLFLMYQRIANYYKNIYKSTISMVVMNEVDSFV